MPPTTLKTISVDNIQSLKLLNSSLIPVRYSSAFYRDLLETPYKSISRLAFEGSLCIGAITSRVETVNDQRRVYSNSIF